MSTSINTNNNNNNNNDSTITITNEQQAIQLLKESTWFRDASETLVQALAQRLVPLEAPDGFIFVEEGQPHLQIILIDEGTLQRTKLSLEREQIEELHNSIRHLPVLNRADNLVRQSVLVDEISGRGRITGLLHNVRDCNTAYATVSAKGPVKVWLLAGEDFRDAITATPEHALDVMAAMAHELRVGSKSLRGLIHRVKSKGTAGSDGNLKGLPTKVCKVLCYDTTAWVTEGFKPAIEVFNEQQMELFTSQAAASKSDHAAAKKEEEEVFQIEMEFTTERLGERSATYAAGFDAVCLFVNDSADANVIQTLSVLGVGMIAMRSAGFDRVDTKAAKAYGMTVARVPAYSPYAVAEMAVALLMAVNRKIAKANNRAKMANFTLDSGLMGMDIHGKTVGVMGTGKIGQILCDIMLGFSAKLLCYDVYQNDHVKEKGGIYVSTQDEIFTQCDIIFLMMPLLPATHHIINEDVLPKLKHGVLLVNTSRGGLIDTKALLKGLQSGVIGGVGIDVYENEQEYFFQDWSARQVQDLDLVALLGNQSVVLTAHQAFFTKEAVDKIIQTTLENIRDYSQAGLRGQAHPNNCIPASM